VQSLLPALAEGAAGRRDLAGIPQVRDLGFRRLGHGHLVKPGDDFYKFANGNWDAKTSIPSDRTRYGNFDKLSELSEARTKAIIEGAAADKAATGEKAKIGAAYRAFMDEPAIEKLDAKPIQPWLDGVKKVKTKDEFTALMGKSSTTPYSTLIGLGISTDAKNPKAYAVYASTAGLAARPRLLSGRQVRRQEGRLPGLCREDADPGRLGKAGRERQGRRRFRDQAGRSLVDPRRAPQPRQDLQPGQPGRAAGPDAGL
jgi:putative endopeptidase